MMYAVQAMNNSLYVHWKNKHVIDCIVTMQALKVCVEVMCCHPPIIRSTAAVANTSSGFIFFINCCKRSHTSGLA